jgi:hypothetical protein
MAKGRDGRKRPKTAVPLADQKQPRYQHAPEGGKSPRLATEPATHNHERISWHLGALDLDGPFCPKRIGEPSLADVVDKLRSFETMTWSEIIGKKHHPIPFSGLRSAAQDRLRELKLDDIDTLMSLRFTGACRVLGIRDKAVLRVLWWDPDHGAADSTFRDWNER